MRVVLQRVTKGAVEVQGEVVGSIGPGLVVLVAIGREDTEETVQWMVNKIISLRIFGDQQRKMNCSLQDIGGSLLVISQFTLYGDCRKGRRPGFDASAPPDQAERLYELFLEACRNKGVATESGVFGAMMLVHIDNDGPVTFILERN